MLARELLVGATVAIATLAFGMVRFDVTFLGKAATLLLMFAIPGFMLGESGIAGARFFEVASWVLAIPGLGAQPLHRDRLRSQDPRRHPRRPCPGCGGRVTPAEPTCRVGYGEHP